MKSRPTIVRVFLALFIITVSYSGNIYANTVSWPVSVAIPTGMVGEMQAKPVSVAIPTGMLGELQAKPATVSSQPANLGDPDLIGLWHLDGDWFDSSGNNNHGAPYSGVIFSSDRKSGTQSGSFDGVDDYAAGTTIGFPLGSSARTILAWVKTTDNVGDKAILHYGVATGATPPQNFQLFLSGGKAYVGNGYGYGAIGGTSIVADGVWHLVAGVFEGQPSTIARIYVDGILQNSGAIATPATANQTYTIGRFLAGGGQFKGLIDEVSIYKRALTDEEIAVRYAAGITDPAAPAPPVPNLVPLFIGANAIALSGTSSLNTSIWVNNKKIAVADASGNWAGTYGTLQPSTNILNVAALDVSNRLSQSVTATVFYDNVPPVIASSIPANNSNSAKPVTSVSINLYDANAGVDAAGSSQNATVRNSAGQLIAGSWTISGTTTVIFTPNVPFPADTYTVAIFPVDTVGNRQAQALPVVFTNHDTTKPTTTATLSGTKGSDGWYTTSVTVTLTAADGADGSGVAETEYSLDNVTWHIYTAPVVIDRDGDQYLYFRSTDLSGNVEAPAKSQEVRINKAGLVGLWHMDGDWKDSSVVGNNGTASGATFSVTAKIGPQSGSFDGVNDYVQIPNNPTLNSSKISVELWAKSNAATWNSSGSMVSKRDAYIVYPVQGSKEIRFYGFIAGNWQFVSWSNPDLDITQWHHYVGTYDGATLTLYVDGIKNSIPYAGSINAADTGSLYLGWDDGQSGRYFNGLLDEVAIYNRPLSDTEVQQHYRDFVVASPTVDPVSSPTNIAALTLRGTKSADTAIVVNGNILVPLGATTTWQAAYSLAAGTNNLSVTALDSQNFNSLPVSLTVVLDTTPPQVTATTPQNAALLKTAPGAVTFTLTDAYSPLDPAATLNGAAVTSAGLDVAGSWSSSSSGTSGTVTFTPQMVMTEGTYAATIRPTDSWGNGMTYGIAFTIDTTPPPAPGIDQVTAPINSTGKTVYGTKSTDSATVVVSCAGATVGAVSYPSGTTWSVPLSGLKEGNNTVTASAVDAAGNPGAAATMTFVVDTIPPLKPVITAPVTPTKSSSVSLTGTKEANTSLFVNGQVTAASFTDTAWSYSASLTEGSNSFTVSAKDAAGNMSLTASVSLVRDTTPPLFTVDTYQYQATAATQTISGRKEAGSVVKLNGATIFDAADQSATWSHLLTLTEGLVNHFVFTAADSLGNTATKTIDILYDLAPPAALGMGMLVANGSGKGTEVTLSWPSYVEPADLAYYRVYFSPADFTAVSALTPVGTVSKGTRSFKVSGPTQGTTSFFAVVPVDASGNFDPAVRTASAMPADTVAPEEVTSLSAWAGHNTADGNCVTLSWTPSADTTGDMANQTVYVDSGQGYDAGTAIGKTTTTYTKKGLADATLYKFKVTTKDNGSHESAGVVVTAATRLANPTGLAASPGNGKVTLTWSGVNSPYVKLYNIYRFASATQQSDVAAMILVKSQSGTSFTDTGVSNGTAYQYAVTTLNTSGAERTSVQSIAATPRGDTTGPVISAINLTANQVLTAPITVIASATDAESAMGRMEIHIDGVLAATQNGGSLSYAWNVVDTTDGNHMVKVSAYDSLGNLTEQAVPVVVSLAPPAAPVITTTFGGPITATAVTLSGTTQAGATIILRVNGVVVSSISCAISTFNFPAVYLVEGGNVVSARAANRGGESAWSADLRITVDSGAPSAPTTLTAKPLAGGSIQFAWQAGAGEVPTGYNLYEGEQSFIAKTDAGVRKVNSATIQYLLKEYVPADDATRFYAVAALDGAGNESPISNVAQTASDRLSPSAASVTFVDASGGITADNIYGPGSVTVRLTVSEPLKELPFLSLEPQSGSPIVVSPWKVDDTHYQGAIILDATSPSGPTVWKFSGKDLIGNRGNASGTGLTIDVKGPAASITAPFTLLKTTAGPVPVAVTFDEPSVTTPTFELRSGSILAPVTGLASSDGGLHWSGTLDPASLPVGSATFALSGAKDRFGNIGSTVKNGAALLLYANTPPAPAVPENLVAKAAKGGSVILTWTRVTDAQGYNVYRQGSGDTAPVLINAVSSGATAIYTDTPATDGSFRYSVNSVGLLNNESARSGEVIAVSDRTPPAAPTGLVLSLTGNGINAVWQGVQTAGDVIVEVPATYRLYRAGGAISDVTGLVAVATATTLTATDTAPTSAKRFYAVTALDTLGNESAPSTTGELTFPVAPVRNLLLTLVDSGKPALSWEGGETNLQGFYIFRNGSKINQVPTPSTAYSDGYYSGGSVAYGVSAVNSLGFESPVKEVILPALTIGLKEGSAVRRGMLETVPVQMTLSSPALGEGQGEGVVIDSISLKIGPLPESTLAGPFTVTAVAPLEVQKVAATEATAPPQEAVVTTAIMNPAPGTTVRITKSSVASILGSGTALEIFNEPLVRGTEGRVRLKVNNLGSAQMSFLTSENNGPTGQVKLYLKDQDGNVIAQGNLNQRTGAVVNSGSYATARIEPGGSFLSDPITIAVPATVPARVILDAVIDNTYYHYNQTDQVLAPGLKQSLETTISQVPYSAQAEADKAVYRQGETVTITGQAPSTADGSTTPQVPVKIGVSVGGFDRFFTATTDQAGNFRYVFTPGSSETGTYSLWAIHPDLNDRSVQAQFSIIGMQVSPKLVNVTTTRNKPVDIPVTIKNLAGTELSGLSLIADSSSGIVATVTNGGDDRLSGNESQSVTFRITPQANAPDSGFANLTISTAEGLSDKVTANITLVNAMPAIRTSPSFIDTGLTRGNQKIVSFTLSNTGIETLRNARIEGPSTAWMSLTIDKSVGDVGVSQSMEIGILLKPGDTLSQGIYNDRIVIYADNHIPYTYNIQVTVSSNAVGNVQFSVLDEIMRDVANANITIQHQSVLDLIYTLKTGSDGNAFLFDIPEGRYTFNISASGASPYSGSFVIEPGVTTTVPIALELKLVSIEWSVTPTVIQDRYDIQITQTFETNVPTPVLVMEPPNVTLPELLPGQVFNGEFTVTNYGLIALDNVTINFPTSFDEYDVEILATTIPKRLNAMQKITVPYRITRRQSVAFNSGMGANNLAALCEEVRGFGGSTCYKSVPLFTVHGTAIICPNTPQQRTVDRSTTHYGQTPYACSTGSGTPSTYTPTASVGSGSGSSQISGSGGPGISTSLPTSNQCDCKPDGTVLTDRVAGDCMKLECSGGNQLNAINDNDKPLNTCKDCSGGDIVNLPNGSVSRETFIAGTSCCYEGEAQPNNPINDLAKCPYRVPNPNWIKEYDGCTNVPQNPVEGYDTAFSNPERSGPCDNHDKCYQTCSSQTLYEGQLACDDAMYRDMQDVCEKSIEDEYARNECRNWANMYYTGLRFFGWFVYKYDRQKTVCNCCYPPVSKK
jgi:fibronectin type 3 domain-containing protein